MQDSNISVSLALRSVASPAVWADWAGCHPKPGDQWLREAARRFWLQPLWPPPEGHTEPSSLWGPGTLRRPTPVKKNTKVLIIRSRLMSLIILKEIASTPYCIFAGGLHDLAEPNADSLPLITLVRAQSVLQDGNNLWENLFSQFPNQISKSTSRNLKNQAAH